MKPGVSSAATMGAEATNRAIMNELRNDVQQENEA